MVVAVPPVSPTHHRALWTSRRPAASRRIAAQTIYRMGKMKWLVPLSVLLCLIACHLSEARVIVPEGAPYDEPPAVPYWPYSTSDFWHYIEYFRSIGAYNHINELARAFFAHQHIANTLGYETNEGHEH